METLRQLLDANGMFDEDGYYNEGIYPVVLAQAAWNYKTLLEDKSEGVHNPDYVKALLSNSIEALQEQNYAYLFIEFGSVKTYELDK